MVILSASGYNSTAVTYYDGVSPDQRPSFYSLDGSNGIRVTVNASSEIHMNYYISLWVRSKRTTAQLGTVNECLFEVQGRANCYFTSSKTTTCQSLEDQTTTLSTSISSLEGNFWVHLAFSGDSNHSSGYMLLSYPDQVYSLTTGPYLMFKGSNFDFKASLGISYANLNPFMGDLREFLVYNMYIDPNQVPNIKNQVIYWDTKLLAYYRFLNGNMYDAIRLNLASFVSTSNTIPSLTFDSAPNTICYPPQLFINLPYLSIPNNTQGQSISKVTLDERFNRSSYHFQYSVSIWLYLMKPAQTTVNPYVGSQQLYFMNLEEVFSLWFNDTQEIAMYINTVEAYNSLYTQAIFFPFNEWGNLQFIIDEATGYEMRVYNYQRQLMAQQSNKVFINQQQPTGKFNIISNFNGYLKSVIIYEANTGFPITNTPGSQYDTSGTVLIYYKFDQSFFNGKQLRSLDKNPKYGIGPTLNFTQMPVFSVISFNESIPYNFDYNYGSMQQSVNLFDGVTCNDQNFSILLNGTQSFIWYSLPSFSEPLSEFSVEFWFNVVTPVSAKSYLFSLFQITQKLEYFAVIFDSDLNLKCIPFPYSSSSSAYSILTVSNTSYNTIGWQHISCNFKSQYEFVAYYDSLNNGQTQVQIDLNQQVYQLPNGSYKLYIGNNNSTKIGSQSTFFKELKLWSQDLPYTSVYNNLKLKLDPYYNPNLLSYFQLASGSTVFIDYVNPTAPPGSFANVILMPESTYQICPEYAYPLQYSTGCSRDPFLEQDILVFAEPLSASPWIQWHFTTKYSSFVNQNIYIGILNEWSVPNLSGNISSSLNSSSLYLYPDNLIDNQVYNVSVLSKNEIKSFARRNSLNFIPISCRYVGDSDTFAQVQDVIVFQPQNTSQISLQFQVFHSLASLCSSVTEYLTLDSTVDVKVSPSYLPQFTIIQYSAQNGTFNLLIPASQQAQLPSEQYINIIITIKWQDQLYNIQSLNQVYRLMFAYPVFPIMDLKFNNILVNQNMVINATDSYIMLPDSNSSVGLAYYWTCPLIFNAICQQQINQRILTITYSEFQNAGGQFNIPYNFSLSVWRASNPDSHANSTASVLVQWVNVNKPDFSINILRNQVLASSDNQFSIDFSNYSPDNITLNYLWSMNPSLQNLSSFTSFSPDNSILTVLSGTFQFNTTYTLNVTVYSSLFPDESMTTQILTFTTGIPPLNGQVMITPLSGTFFETPINISISGWQSNAQPVIYQIYGVTMIKNEVILLTQTYLNQSNQYFYSVLPSLDQVIVEITDQNGESTFVTQNISISYDPSITNYTSYIQQASQTSDNGQRYSQYFYIAQQLLISDLNSTTQKSSANLNSRQDLINIMQQDLSNILSGQNPDSASQIYQGASNLLSAVTQNYSAITEILAAQSLNLTSILLSNSSSVYNQTMSLSNYQQNIANSLSNVLSFYHIKLSNSSSLLSRRILQSTNSDNNQSANSTENSSSSSTNNSFYSAANVVNILPITNQLVTQVLQQISNLSDRLCDQLSDYEQKLIIQTDMFQVNVEKFSLDSPIYQTAFTENNPSDQEISVPVSDFQSLVSLNSSNVSWICSQAFMYFFNPMAGYKFYNQSVMVPVSMGMNTYDSTSNHLITNQTINLNSYYGQIYSYNFNFTTNRFIAGITLCAYTNTPLIQDNTIYPWIEDNCATIYEELSNSIKCECSTVGPYLYTIINDYTKPINYSYYNNSNGTQNNATNSENGFKFQSEALAIIIVLIIFGIVTPAYAVYLDQKEYENLKNDTYQISEEFLRTYASLKKQPLEQVIYKKQLLCELKQLVMINFFTLFCTFSRQLHPFLNIFFKFDIGVKRLVRYMILLYQMCVICIIIVLIFGKKYNDSETDNVDVAIEQHDRQVALVVGAFWGLFTLPLPNLYIFITNNYRLIQCLKTKLVPEQNEQNFSSPHSKHEDKRRIDTAQQNDLTTAKIKTKSNMENDDIDEEEAGQRPQTHQRLQSGEDDLGRSGHQKKNQNAGPHDIAISADSIEAPVKVVDNCFLFKIFLLVLSQALLVLTIIAVSVNSANTPRRNTVCIVISWYMAMLFGWMLVNMIRIAFITAFGLKIYANFKKEEKEQKTCLISCCFCLFMPQDALDILVDIHLIQSQLR